MKLTTKELREIVRLGLAAHGGFHGSSGRPLAEHAEEGCDSCAAIVAVERELKHRERRTENVQLLDLNLDGRQKV